MSDLVERKDVLNCLDNRDFNSYEDYSRTFDAIEDILTVNRWISCDEKLPDDGQICIVKRKFSYKVPCPYMIGVWSSDRNIFSGLRLGTSLEDAISWMPFIDPDEV